VCIFFARGPVGLLSKQGPRRAGGMGSLLSWPSPPRQPRNVRVLAGSPSVLMPLRSPPWSLPWPPLPLPPRGGGILRSDRFPVPSCYYLLGALFITSAKKVLQESPYCPPPVLVASCPSSLTVTLGECSVQIVPPAACKGGSASERP
jgi:hypothetical protein